jgi:hypothetical protein
MYKAYVTDSEDKMEYLVGHFLYNGYDIKHLKSTNTTLIKEGEDTVIIMDECLGDRPHEWACGLQFSYIEIDMREVDLSDYAITYWCSRFRGEDGWFSLNGKNYSYKELRDLSNSFKENKE